MRKSLEQQSNYLNLSKDTKTEGLLKSDKVQARRWDFQYFNFRNLSKKF
jgi:hypothetical protein